MSGPISNDSTVTEVCANLADAELFALGSGRGAQFPALTPEREEAIISILRHRLSSDKKPIQVNLLDRYTRTCRKASVSHSPLPITGIKTCLYILKVASYQPDVPTRQKLASVIEDWRNILAHAVDPTLAGSQTVWACKALRQVCGCDNEVVILPSTNKRRRSLEGEDGGPNITAHNSLPPAQRLRVSAPTPELMAFSVHRSDHLSTKSSSIQEIVPKGLGMPTDPVTLDSDDRDIGRALPPDALNAARSGSKNDSEAQTAEARCSSVTNNPVQEDQPSASSHGTVPKDSLTTVAQDVLSEQASRPFSMAQGPTTLPLRCIEPAPSSANDPSHASTQSALRSSVGQSLVQSAPSANRPLLLADSRGLDKPSDQLSGPHTSQQSNSLGPQTSAFDPRACPRPPHPTVASVVAPSSGVAQWEKAVRLLDLALTELIHRRPLPAPALLDPASLYIPNPFSPSYLWTPQNLHSYACPIVLSANGGSFTNFTPALDRRIPTNAPVVTPQPSGDSWRVSTPLLAQSPQMLQREVGLNGRLSQSSTQAPSSPAVSQSHPDTQSGAPKQVASPPALSRSTSNQRSTPAQADRDCSEPMSMPSNNDSISVPVAKSASLSQISEAQKAKFVETFKRVDSAGKMRLEAKLRRINLWDFLSPLLSSSSNDLQKQNRDSASALNPQLSTNFNSIPQHGSPSLTSRCELPPVSSASATSLAKQVHLPEIQFLGQSSPRPSNGSSRKPASNAPRINPPAPMHPPTPSSSTVSISGLDPTLTKMLTAMLCNEPQSSAVLLTALASLGVHNRIAILNHLKALACCYSSGKDIMWKLRVPSGPQPRAAHVQPTLQTANNPAPSPASHTAALRRPTDHSKNSAPETNPSHEAPNATISGTGLPVNAMANPAAMSSPQDRPTDSHHFQEKHAASEKGKQPVHSITQVTLTANSNDRRPSASTANQPLPVNNPQNPVQGQKSQEFRAANSWNQFQKLQIHQAVMRQDERLSKNAPKEAVMELLHEIHDQWKKMPAHEKEKFKRVELSAQAEIESFSPSPNLSRPSNNQTPVAFVAKQQALSTSFSSLDVSCPSTDPRLGPTASSFLQDAHPQQCLAPENDNQSYQAMPALVSRKTKEKMAVGKDGLLVINPSGPSGETEKSAQVAISGLSSTAQPAPNKPLNGAKLSSSRSSPQIPGSKTCQIAWQLNAFQDDLPGYPDVNPAFQIKGTRARILARYPHNQQMPPIRTFAPLLVKTKTR